MQSLKKIVVAGFLLSGSLCVWAQSSFTLQKALQAARQNNPTLKTQRLTVGIAQADIITAKLRPNLNLNNQSLQLIGPAYYAPHTDWSSPKNRQIWWQLTKPFQLPSQRRNKIDFATLSAQYAEKLYTETERNLFQDVALKWLDVWSARKQLDLLQLAKANTDSLVIINRLRYKNQVINQTDVSRTELLASQFALQITAASQNYRNELYNLRYMLGTADTLNIDTASNFMYAFPEAIDSLMNQALNKRSDLQAMKTNVDVANSNIKLQRSLMYPIPELGAIWNPQNTIPYLGFYGTIQLPIFSRNQGEIKKSQLLKQYAEQDMQNTQTHIQVELMTAYNSYKVQKENLNKYASIITQSETILNNVKYAYLRGSTSIIDFLEAQRSWLETQQQYYETLQRYRESYIRLLFVSGLINQMAE